MANVGSTQDIKTGSKTAAQLLNDLLREQFTGLSSNVTEGIGLFGENLGEQNQFFLGAADRFKRASEGVDPRFEAFRNRRPA